MLVKVDVEAALCIHIRSTSPFFTGVQGLYEFFYWFTVYAKTSYSAVLVLVLVLDKEYTQNVPQVLINLLIVKINSVRVTNC